MGPAAKDCMNAFWEGTTGICPSFVAPVGGSEDGDMPLTCEQECAEESGFTTDDYRSALTTRQVSFRFGPAFSLRLRRLAPKEHFNRATHRALPLRPDGLAQR
jgi:hypothetical protein